MAITTDVKVKETQTDEINIFFYINSRHFVPAIVIFGSINNIFVLVILSLPQYRKHVSCLYLKCLAIFDTVSLITVGLLSSENALPVLTATLGDAFCALIGFAINFTPEMSSWIIVAITFTRFLAVVYPLHAKSWTTFRAAKTYLAFLFLTFFLSAIPDILYNRIPSDGIVLNFGCVMMMEEVHLEIYHTTHMIVGVGIPIFLLLILNIPIIYKLARRQKEIVVLTTTTPNKDEGMVIMMTMVVTLAFFVLGAPYVFHFIIWYFVSSIYALDNTQLRQRTLSYTIIIDLFAINCSINFLLYFVTCKRFRTDFKTLLLCRLLHKTDLQKG
jgi:hypothetical protein